MQATFSLSEHLILLRKNLIKVSLFFLLILILALIFSRTIYTYLAQPLLLALPNQDHLIATNITSPLLVPMKLAVIVSLLLVLPYALLQIWQFISPGLYQKEKQFSRFFIVATIALFYLGILFAYFIVFPLIFKFFVLTTPKGVVMLPDISQYLNFVMKLFFAFGMAFEIPVFVLLLVKAKLVTIRQLKKLRPYMIVVAFILGMLLTPPDVISQILLAIPLCGLYELGLIAARFIEQ
ncbi:MAG: twin-arginine translocase subunit TatC [Pseudomonadota bacterium]